MTTTALTTTGTRADFQAIIAMVVDGLGSEHSRRGYARALGDFLSWWDDEGRPTLSKAVVQRYTRHLQASGLGASTINMRLSAIRSMAREAADNGLIDPHLAAGIGRVKGIKNGGTRSGNWLSKQEAQDLLEAPDTDTLKGLRDQAILAVLLSSGLRRAELADLTVDHICQRDGRWVIVDIVGKGNKVRSVPIAPWAKVAIDRWLEATGITEGLIFRSVYKGGRVNGKGMTSQTVYNVVRAYANGNLATHDLRRTFAKLADKGGASLVQIQKSLGHSSVKTTELYVGADQDFTDAPCDHLGLRL